MKEKGVSDADYETIKTRRQVNSCVVVCLFYGNRIFCTGKYNNDYVTFGAKLGFYRDKIYTKMETSCGGRFAFLVKCSNRIDARNHLL